MFFFLRIKTLKCVQNVPYGETEQDYQTCIMSVLQLVSKTPKCMQSNLFWVKETTSPETCYMRVFEHIRQQTINSMENNLYMKTKHYEKRVF